MIGIAIALIVIGVLFGFFLPFGWVVGIVGLILAVLSWQVLGFGALDPRTTMREVIPAAVLLTLGVQTVFASFFLSILGIDSESDPR